MASSNASFSSLLSPETSRAGSCVPELYVSLNNSLTSIICRLAFLGHSILLNTVYMRTSRSLPLSSLYSEADRPDDCNQNFTVSLCYEVVSVTMEPLIQSPNYPPLPYKSKGKRFEQREQKNIHRMSMFHAF